MAVISGRDVVFHRNERFAGLLAAWTAISPPTYNHNHW